MTFSCHFRTKAWPSHHFKFPQMTTQECQNNVNSLTKWQWCTRTILHGRSQFQIMRDSIQSNSPPNIFCIITHVIKAFPAVFFKENIWSLRANTLNASHFEYSNYLTNMKYYIKGLLFGYYTLLISSSEALCYAGTLYCHNLPSLVSKKNFTTIWLWCGLNDGPPVGTHLEVNCADQFKPRHIIILFYYKWRLQTTRRPYWLFNRQYVSFGQKCDYNIPRACLLNRSPVPAMDLKSNRSDLWRRMLETCRRLRDYVASLQTMSRDMIKLQLSQHFCRATKIFCRATWVSCRVGVTLCCDFYTFRSCNTCTFSLPTLAVLQHTT